MTWRDIARPVIERVLLDNPIASEKEIRKLLHDAYPFGPRQYHPYKIWCDEIRVQLGKKKPKRSEVTRKKNETQPCKGQMELL
jgi:hypothetical protein